MQLSKVDISTINGEVRFVLWVWCWDEMRKRDRAYTFKWYDENVIFMFGGWKGEARVVGQATAQNKAVEVAEQWLEGWLTECGVL